jgi:hypothetical protein
MPGFLLHEGAQVKCTHQGDARPAVPNPRVKVSGQATVLMPVPYGVAGCPFVSGTVPTPCVTGQWTTAATRITSMGQPLVLFDSRSVCAPNGTPLVVLLSQTRVTGT